MIPRRNFLGLPVIAGTFVSGFAGRLLTDDLFQPKEASSMGNSEAHTVYVRIDGNDTVGDGVSPTTAFRTPQRAIDSLPELVDLSVQIDIGPGIYSTSSRAPQSLDRPAVIYIDQLRSGRRTSQEAEGLIGSIVLKLDPNTVIQAGKNGYDYGIYCTGHSGSIAIWGGKVEAGARCNTLITAHRGTYVHLRKMQVDGSKGASVGLLAEAGGFLECVDTAANGSKVDLQTYSGSFAQMAAPNSSHEIGQIAVGPGSMASIFMRMRVTQSLTNRGICELNGGPNSRVSLEGSYDGRNSQLHAIRTDFISKEPDAVIAKCDNWHTGDLGFDCALNLHGGVYHLAGSRAFVGGNRSPHARPVRAIPGTFIYRDASIDWTNSEGIKKGVYLLPLTVSIPDDNFTIPITFNSGASGLIQLINQTGSIRRNCVIADVAATTNGHHPDTGSELTLVHVEGQEIEIALDAECIGNPQKERLILGRGPRMARSARFVWLDQGWVRLS